MMETLDELTIGAQPPGLAEEPKRLFRYPRPSSDYNTLGPVRAGGALVTEAAALPA